MYTSAILICISFLVLVREKDVIYSSSSAITLVHDLMLSNIALRIDVYYTRTIKRSNFVSFRLHIICI
jgi:hypothetical protein